MQPTDITTPGGVFLLFSSVLLTVGCGGETDQLAAQAQGLTSDLFVAMAIAFSLVLVTLLFIALFVRERSISKSLRRFIHRKENTDGKSQ